MSNTADQFSWPKQPAPLRPVPAGPASLALTAGSDSAAAFNRCVDSGDILRGQRSAEISHNGSTYRLQATRLGKLILTK